MPEPQTLGDLFAEEEARLLAQGRAEIAAEKAAWDALTPEEQHAQLQAIEDKYRDDPDDEGPVPCAGCGDPDCDFDCDGDYDADEDD